MRLTLRYTITLETTTESKTPNNNNQGLVFSILSPHLPRSANRTIGIAIVYPSSHASCHALKFGKSTLVKGVPESARAGVVSFLPSFPRRG